MRCLFLLLSLLLSWNTVLAQSVTVGDISKTTYCTGDTVWVPYSTTGSFSADNFFAAQLSDANGSFQIFKNFGHETALNGTIPVIVGNSGDHIHARIISSDPYSLSSNLSAELHVYNYPRPQPSPMVRVTSFGYAAFVGDVIQCSDGSSEPSGSSYLWKFDQDASILTSTNPQPTLFFTAVGTKTGSLTVTNPSGCSTTSFFNIKILSCNPVIPDTTHVVTGTEFGNYPYVWVKPGGNFTVRGGLQGHVGSIVFAESGSSVSTEAPSNGFYYLKKDASFNWNPSSNALVVLGNGNRITFKQDLHYIDTLNCDDLQFDYSQVGGNAVEQTDPHPLHILNSPNALRIRCDGEMIRASVVNLLGAEILSGRERDVLSLDLNAFPAGVYFAIISSGDHRELRKISVIH